MFEQDHENYQWIVFDSVLVENAKYLFKKYGLNSLKTLDALQRSAALKVKDDVEVFITNDEFLRKLFKDEGLNIKF
ncbi:MAG: type II toxin-antitoxin system VapC family toxin [Bacteroidia bacterium]|nr:type II toxin-antitoxin system VapC family toxin [Bacteroidia bacterium]